MIFLILVVGVVEIQMTITMRTTFIMKAKAKIVTGGNP